MAATLLLDLDEWDFCLDAAGNWAMASEPYAQTQDVASAVRVFAGEVYYDTTLGIPYFTEVLGLYQPTQVLRERARLAALTVPGVIDATALLAAGPDRTLTGQIQVVTAAGEQVLAI